MLIVAQSFSFTVIMIARASKKLFLRSFVQ